MRALSPVTLLGLAVVAASCTTDPCAAVLTEDEALASTCGITNDTPVTPVGPTRCTPSAGTICTIIGNGEACVGVNDVAGTGRRGYGGDRGPALMADLYRPHGIAFDAAGNLFICDTLNDRVRRVWR